MFTADQLVAHAVGDYILQSDWMANEKTKQHTAAAIHAATYTLPFFLLTQSPAALWFIFGTHFFIDRYRLARYLVWLKNGPWRRNGGWSEMTDAGGHTTRMYDYELKPITATGYQDDKPAFLSVWLLIIADNIIHVCCNALALRYLV